MSDTMLISCFICTKVVRSETGDDGWKISPSKAIRWHEAMIAHLRREHVGKRTTEMVESNR